MLKNIKKRGQKGEKGIAYLDIYNISTTFAPDFKKVLLGLRNYLEDAASFRKQRSGKKSLPAGSPG
ncbi:MAG: hypothetical protein LBM62_08685 [Mediterranea sp.]|nr:hypothetical protein [Mediterranea sp.]